MIFEMVEPKAHPTVINGGQTITMCLSFLLLLCPYNRFNFSLKMCKLSDSFVSSDRLFHLLIVFSDKRISRIALF